jgi:hypothetical protein
MLTEAWSSVVSGILKEPIRDVILSAAKDLLFIVQHKKYRSFAPLRMTAFKGLFSILMAALGFSAALVFAQDPAQSPSPPQLAPRPPVVSPKAQDILDKTIQALGGTAFLSFKRLTTTGRAFAIEDEKTAGLAPFESYMEYPDKRRFSYGKKLPVVLINDGERGWEVDRYGKTTQKRDQLLRWQLTTRYGLENLLRVRIHEPGMLIQDSGTDFVDQFPARAVTMVDAREVEIKLYVNKTSYLPVRIQYRVRNAQGDDSDVYADGYADYQTFQGIKTPMHITRFLNNERLSETYRNTAKYDEDYPVSYFQAPY